MHQSEDGGKTRRDELVMGPALPESRHTFPKISLAAPPRRYHQGWLREQQLPAPGIDFFSLPVKFTARSVHSRGVFFWLLSQWGILWLSLSVLPLETPRQVKHPRITMERHLECPKTSGCGVCVSIRSPQDTGHERMQIPASPGCV